MRSAGAQLRAQSQPFVATRDSLRLYYVGRPVGWERYEFTQLGSGSQLVSDFDYIDRGRRNHLAGTMTLGANFQPQALIVERVTDTSRTVTTRVTFTGREATVLRNGVTSQAAVPATAFALSPYQPLSQHLALVRFWLAHDQPATLSVVPGGPVNQVRIVRSGVDSLAGDSGPIVLTRYTIDGVMWGIEYLWLDGQGRMAMFASAAGGLSFKAVRAALVPGSMH